MSWWTPSLGMAVDVINRYSWTSSIGIAGRHRSVRPLLGFTGNVSGTGATETARWDNSIKYTYQYGPVHAGAMYTNGGPETAMFGGGYGFNIGGEYRGFSLDATYQNERGEVNSSAFGIPDPTSPTATTPTSRACYYAAATDLNPANAPGNLICPNGLSGSISDDSSWAVQAKYSFNVGRAHGMEDEYATGGKVTLYGGFERVYFNDPRSPVAPGSQTVGGYTVNNTPFGTTQVRELEWGGAKYEIDKWTATVAYYHYGQNDTLTGAKANITCTAQKGGASRDKRRIALQIAARKPTIYLRVVRTQIGVEVLGPGIIEDGRDQIEVSAAVRGNCVAKEYALALVSNVGIGSSKKRFSSTLPAGSTYAPDVDWL
jgi:hypothetical protein